MPAGERSLCIVKPHAVANGHELAIKDVLESAGFHIVAEAKEHIALPRAEEYCSDQIGSAHHAEVVAHLSSGESYIIVVEKENAVSALLELAGPADAEVAAAESPESLGSLVLKTLSKSVIRLLLLGSTSSYFSPIVSTDIHAQTWLGNWLINNSPIGDHGASATSARRVAEEVVGRLGKGDYFGEIALLLNKPRQVSVRVTSPVLKVLYMDRESFSRILGPLHDILKRNLENYNAYGGNDFVPLTDDPAVEISDNEEGREKNDEKDDQEQEAAPMPAFRRERRKPVFVEPIKMDEPWEPRVVEKTAEEKERIRSILKDNIMFSHLDTEQSNVVINAMEGASHKAGENIINQGDAGDYFYLLDSGEAEVYVKKGDAEPKKVLEYSPGQSFGELALLHGDPRAATVKAKSDTHCWALDRDTFRRILMSTSFKKQQTYEGFLENVKILADLTKYERFRVADALQSATYGEGDVIINEGEEGDIFYIIEENARRKSHRVLHEATHEAIIKVLGRLK